MVAFLSSFGRKAVMVLPECCSPGLVLPGSALASAMLTGSSVFPVFAATVCCGMPLFTTTLPPETLIVLLIIVVLLKTFVTCVLGTATALKSTSRKCADGTKTNASNPRPNPKSTPPPKPTPTSKTADGGSAAQPKNPSDERHV